MFTVPGWNVSAPITAQVEKPKQKDPNKLGKKALKRKEKQETQVNAENIGEYWDKAVEVNDVKLPESPKVQENGVEDTGDGAQEKRGKKRKRGPRKKAESGDAAAEKKDVAASTPKIAETNTPAISAEKPTTTDTDSKRDKKKRKKDSKPTSTDSATTPPISAPLPVSLLPPEPVGLTPLQRSMRSKLASARFRHLNESLYTKPSAESLDLFKTDPTMFADYHRGFAQQVEVWPSNPVDSYVASILARGKLRTRDPWKDKKRQEKKSGVKTDDEPESTLVPLRGDAKPLPRNFKGHATIADLGCGTASLSYRLQSQLSHLNLTLHSFDLSKPSGPSGPLVTVADISALPLPSGSVDVAIFCLALMGTNWLDFIDEAYRVLRWRGELWISEIKSRFARPDAKSKTAAGGTKVPINSIGSLRKPLPPKGRKNKPDKPEDDGIADSADEAELAHVVDGAAGKESTDVSAFVDVLKARGFVLDALPERASDAIDLSNKMFVKLAFTKSAPPVRGKNVAKGDAGVEGKGGSKERGAARSGPGGMKFGLKGKKFGIVADGAGDVGDKDMKVLKPCLYKVR